ncbi:MAG TPA: type II toxin-antitoxin system VapC family toxin, partial [Gemmatimonadaceae bacterium]
MPLAYLLDTNICIDLIRQRSARAASRLVSHRVDEVAVSSLTVAELEYGVAKSRFGSMDRERLDQFL